MRRRMLGLLASLVLAAFGTIVLAGYVQSAHDRAAAGEPTASVLVVKSAVPKGTKATDLEGKVAVKEVPASAKVAGAVTKASELGDTVASTGLVPGEQVLAERFVPAAALGREGVPEGLLEVTVQLDPQRAVGGALKPGDTVAVLASFTPFETDAGGGTAKTPNTTSLILHKVLVTAVQATDAEAVSNAAKENEETEERTLERAPSGQLLVTLALDAGSVERVVFAAEYGSLWLSAQPSDAPDGGTRIQTRGTIYG